MLTGYVVGPHGEHSAPLPRSIKVRVDTLAATFVDSVGYYALTFWTKADSLTLVGQTGYGPYIYPEICSGRVKFAVARRVSQDITLDRCNPI